MTNMTWKQARIRAAQICAQLDLPHQLPGVRVRVRVAAYDDEDTLRFLKSEEPDLSLREQELINQAFARELRKRGARVEFVLVSIADYFAWLGRENLENTPAARAQFIRSRTD